MAKPVTFTLAELLQKMRTAQSVMSRKNAHRVLFGQCEAVLLALVEELERVQKGAAHAQKG